MALTAPKISSTSTSKPTTSSSSTTTRNGNNFNGTGYAYTDHYGFSHVVNDLKTAQQYGQQGSIQQYTGNYGGGYALGSNGQRMAVPTKGAVAYGNDANTGGTQWASSSVLSPLQDAYNAASQKINNVVNQYATPTKVSGVSTTTPSSANTYGLGQNQYDYLNWLSSGANGTGNAEWAKAQLADAQSKYSIPSTSTASSGVALRQQLESQGYKVDYDNSTGSIQVSKDGKTSVLSPGQYTNNNGTAYITADQFKQLTQPQTQELPAQPTQMVQPVQQLNPMDWLAQQQQQMQQLWQAHAQKQAQDLAKQKTDALQTLIDRLKGNQKTGLEQINNSVADSNQALEDKSFQNFLAARQAMANRGLAGSGLASDQDTRLLLAKQKDLSGVYRDAATRASALNNQYSTQLDDAYKQLSDINVGSLASDAYSKLYTDGMKALNDQFGNIVDWAKWGTPSANQTLQSQTDLYKWLNPSADNVLDNQTDLYKWNNLSAADQTKYLWENFKFNNVDANTKATLQNAANIASNNNANAVTLANLNNASRENVAKWNNQTQLTVNENNNATKLEEKRQSINMQMKQLESQQWNQTGSQLVAQAKTAFQGAQDILARLKVETDPTNKAILTQTYNNLVNQGNTYLGQAQQNTTGGSGSQGNVSADFPITN